MEYRVVWCIDVDAENEREAAEEAQRIMKDPESTATFFDVMEGDSEGIGWLDGLFEEFMLGVQLGDS
jgi:hypothetical protein